MLGNASSCSEAPIRLSSLKDGLVLPPDRLDSRMSCAHEAAGRWVLGERQFMADSSLIESVNWPVLSIRFLQKAQIKSNAVCWGQIWLIADIAIGQQP
jgi:hypothetical protein